MTDLDVTTTTTTATTSRPHSTFVSPRSLCCTVKKKRKKKKSRYRRQLFIILFIVLLKPEEEFERAHLGAAHETMGDNFGHLVHEVTRVLNHPVDLVERGRLAARAHPEPTLELLEVVRQLFEQLDELVAHAALGRLMQVGVFDDAVEEHAVLEEHLGAVEQILRGFERALAPRKQMDLVGHLGHLLGNLKTNNLV